MTNRDWPHSAAAMGVAMTYFGQPSPRPSSSANSRGEITMAKTKKQAQALAIKLSRERRSGKEVPPPAKGRYSEKARKKALRDLEVGRQRKKRRGAKKRSAKKR
jgi:hypothetical protein